MVASIIDGKKVAGGIKEDLKQQVAGFLANGDRAPCLAVVLVGEDPASKVYVGHKEKACAAVGIRSVVHRVPSAISQDDLKDLLKKLAEDDSVDGILLQLPLPKGLNQEQALDCIPAAKDVDGLTPANQGLLAVNRQGLFSCTPLGCMELLKSLDVSLVGKRAVVVGRSILVGSPISLMLRHQGATVTVCHSKTVDPEKICREADVLVVAAGVKELVGKDWVKEGAVVIDVGIHRTESGLVGDVDFDEIKHRAGAITPVPGGVGPMTIAMLLSNCVTAYKRR